MKTICCLSACLILLCAGTKVRALQIDHGPDSLLKKALKSADLNIGLSLAKKAIGLAKFEHHRVVEIKGLEIMAELYLAKQNLGLAKLYTDSAIALAGTLKMDSLKGNSYITQGTIDYKKQAYTEAIAKYSQAIYYYRQNNRALNIAAGYLNIGICCEKLSQFREAISYYLTACKTFDTFKDSTYLAYSFNAAAVCFVSLKDYSKAIAYNKKTLAIRLNLHDSRSIAQSFNNLGFAFKEYGRVDSAIYYLSKSITIYKKESDSSWLALPLQNMGSAVKLRGDFKTAERYFDRSLIISAKYHMRAETARGNLDKAELYLAEKNYRAALVAADITQPIAATISLPEVLMNVYALKAKVFTKTGQSEQALFYTNKKDVIKDSIFTVEKNNVIAELDIKYQTRQKEKDIATLNLTNDLQKKVVKQQTSLIIVLIIASVLMLVLFALTYHNFRLKNKANQRIQTLMRDMHHRVKNNLMILSGLFSMQINEHNDEKTKNTLRENESRLTSMNLIHSKLYQDSDTTQIEMRDYLTKLLTHIQESFGGYHITLQIDVDETELDADKAVAVGLIVNELTTNAFKYAFDKKKSGEISLTLKHSGKAKLCLRLHDNGKGISTVQKENGASFGLKLVNLMARQLNSKLVSGNNNGTFYEMEIAV